MKKAIRGLVVLLALIVLLTGCASGKAVSTKSADNKGPSVELIMREIKDQRFETLAAFDLRGQLLFRLNSDSDKSTVFLPKERLEQFRACDGALIMHNHPSGTPFSVTDLQSEALRKTPKAAVVTGDALYILEPGWRGWGDPDELSQAYKDYIDYYTDEAKKSGSPNTWREPMIYHQALTATALDFDLNYRRVSMDEILCFRGTDVVVVGK